MGVVESLVDMLTLILLGRAPGDSVDGLAEAAVLLLDVVAAPLRPVVVEVRLLMQTIYQSVPAHPIQ